MNIEMLTASKGIRFITLTNDTGLEVILCSYGASIYSLKVDLEEMVLTPKNFNVFYHSGKYYGMTIGRIAGRIPNGILKVHDQEYQLEQNEGTNCLHSGSSSIARKNFRTQIQTSKEFIKVSFYLTTKNKEGGFNGKCEYIVSYTMYATSNTILMKYDAFCKEDTYFALTNHSYFNIGHEKDILNHKLRIKANEVSTFDEENFCINGYKPVEGTIFDFREGKVLRKDINNEELHNIKWLNGFDHRFHLDDVPNTEAKLSLAAGNYKLEIFTDFDSVHVYTNGFTTHDELINGDRDDIYRGIALECSNLTPEKKKKKEHYIHYIKYNFRRKSDEI